MKQNFFMYSEELDLCRRIKEAGWNIVYVPDAQVIHYEGKSSEQAVAARHIHFKTSKVRYYRKWHGRYWRSARVWLLEPICGRSDWNRSRVCSAAARSASSTRGGLQTSHSIGAEMKIGLITGEYPPHARRRGRFYARVGAGVDSGRARSARDYGQREADRPQDGDGVRVHRVVKSWGLGCWRHIADMARRKHLDVLNIQYEPAAYAMQVGVNFLPSRTARRLIKAPIVTTFHDLLVPYLFPKAGPLRWKVVEYLARHSDAMIVTNEEDRDRLSNLQHEAA